MSMIPFVDILNLTIMHFDTIFIVNFNFLSHQSTKSYTTKNFDDMFLQ